ncbi:hypothetical protein [Streptomyces sp. NPDC056600]|uniref:hypothetical protein n=1 Tax=Streptomyces sp. NPDC056600 TaxID=3345874 RepID=UPI003696EED6
MTVVRAAAVVLLTWVVLFLLLVAPSLLPPRWQYYVYSPASVGLWMLSLLVAPFVTCAFAWRWIRSGRR